MNPPARHARDQPLVWPRAQVEMLEGLGHWPHAEAPDVVAQHLVPFLGAHSGVVRPGVT